MADSPSTPTDPRRPGETPTERLDRNWSELLQELRVSQTGVQILFSLLLTLPFTQRFTALSRAQRALYTATLLLAALASALIIAPVAYHRLVFRRHAKGRLVAASNALAGVGLVCLALAITGTVALVTSALYGLVGGARFGVVSAAVFVLLWLVLPLAGRWHRDD